jgi:hypothetical protein
MVHYNVMETGAHSVSTKTEVSRGRSDGFPTECPRRNR